MVKHILSVFLLILASNSIAQNEEDALRYSQNFIGGTARNISMAGAMTALGGDFSAVSQNPAAMGRFSKHNFVFTPMVENNISNSNYYGSENRYVTNSVKIGNISYLKAYDLTSGGTDIESNNGWYGLQMGVGYNRLNSFNKTEYYKGDVDSSIIHSFIKTANGTSPANIFNYFPWDAGLAYDVYAIDADTFNTYSTELYGRTNQERTIHSKGGIGEYSFAISGNYKDKFLIGGTFNINRVKYETRFNHTENYLDSSSWLNSLEYLGNLTTKGYGVNAKLGLIYLPTDNIRLGFALHTPTMYQLKDTWGNDMQTRTDDPNNPIKFVKTEYKPTGEYDYIVKTPLKANFSAGFIIKKMMSIGAEVEYLNFSGSKLRSVPESDAPYSFTAENEQIGNVYTQSFNFKIGTEFRINPMFYLRAGYAYFQSPYTKGSGVNTSATQFITGGGGVNFGQLYLDLAIAQKSNNYEYFGYDPTLNGSNASFINKNTTASISVGYRFE
jgi:long-subunit fatty acid transport protein